MTWAHYCVSCQRVPLCSRAKRRGLLAMISLGQWCPWGIVWSSAYATAGLKKKKKKKRNSPAAVAVYLHMNADTFQGVVSHWDGRCQPVQLFSEEFKHVCSKAHFI